MEIPKLTCIIPARYKSTRFPGKPLVDIAGKSMIVRVYENAVQSKYFSEVIVATDDEKIFNHCKDHNANVRYTSEDCKNGSERVAEVAKDLSAEYVFEMQGDQPLVTPEIIDDFISRAFERIEKESNIDVVIPYAEATDEQTKSPDVLKVVVTASEKLTFQSRHPLETGFRTLGLYIWKRDALVHFSELSVSRVEKAEDSHPIRLYVNDFVVQGLRVEETDWVEVDREHQIKQVEDILNKKGVE